MSDVDRLRYLESSAIIEPLVNRLYAWLHIVARIWAAMNLAFQVRQSTTGYELTPLHPKPPTNENACRFKQIDEFSGWCKYRGIAAEPLFTKREWRW